jgi:site-specific DNA recombinase
MVVGYVRLSKDDNKKDYVSIENQKLILTQFAKSNGLYIERWYEDDGVSGYTFDRPGFIKLIADLEKDVDVVLAKDLSRIGRHNARVLLFLEEVKEMGKRILLADDAYDSHSEEDDTLGIKTWFNERYVKDTSKKIRKAIRARQIEGTLAVNTPFGYLRNPYQKKSIEIDEEAAPIVRRIFALYLSGYGFRAIAEQLDHEGVPTASLMEKERVESIGKHYNKRIAFHWSPKMVGEIIKNDIYIGTMRYHKNERVTIHGRDNRVDKEKHMVFLNHHPAIIEENTYQLAMQTLHHRRESNYRGLTSKVMDRPRNANTENNYRGIVLCETCNSRMTMIHRKGREPYYICGKYNSKGKSFCSQSRQIKLSDLDRIILTLRKLYLRADSKLTKQIYQELRNEKACFLDHQIHELNQEIEKEKKELKCLILQKMKLSEETSDKVKIQVQVREEMEQEKIEKLRQLYEKLNEIIIQRDQYPFKLLHKEKTYIQLKADIQNKFQIEIQDEVQGGIQDEILEKNQTEIHDKILEETHAEELQEDKELLRKLEAAAITRQEILGLIEKIVVTPDGQSHVFLTHRVYETGWYAGDGIRVYTKETGN